MKKQVQIMLWVVLVLGSLCPFVGWARKNTPPLIPDKIIQINIRPVAEVGKKGEGIENKEEMGEE